MVGQSEKRKRQKCNTIKYLDNSPISRTRLKQLARAKLTPEIYKEVLRSQRRRTRLFSVPDIKFQSRSKNIEGKENGFGEQTVLNIGSRNQSLQDKDSCENNGVETSLSDVPVETNGQKLDVSALYTSTSDDNSPIVHCESQQKHLEKQFNEVTVRNSCLVKSSEDTSLAMSQRGSRMRNSINGDARAVASPGVITRSQLKQLANAKSVPEEYKHVIQTNEPNGSAKKQEKTTNNRKQVSPCRASVTAKGKRSSKKIVEKEIVHSSSEQINPLDTEENFEVETHHTGGSSKTIRNISETSRSKKKRSAGEGAIKNSKTSSITDEWVSENFSEIFSSSGNDHADIPKQETINEMEVSDEEMQATSPIVDKSLSPSQKLSSGHERGNKRLALDLDCVKTVEVGINGESPDDPPNRSKKKALKSDVQQQKVVGNKTDKNHKGLHISGSSISGKEIINKFHQKVQDISTTGQTNSICEPVDMSISEDCSGTEKMLYSAKSAASDTEASESFVDKKKSTLEISGIKAKTKLLKKDKLSCTQETTKLSEVSSLTSSSYNSGYEITPSKSQSVSKECSLSTKTTDSGITGTLDSNPCCDTDSNTSEVQETLDTVQNLNLSSQLEPKMKEDQAIHLKKSPFTGNSGIITKSVSSIQNESIPSSSGKTPENRQQFLIKLRPSIHEETMDSDSDAESRKAIMLSAQRRIEQNLSATDSDGRRFTPHQPHSSSVPDVEDSDDGPPESMTFEAGRNTATESLRDAVESIRRDRQRRKEKRRARLEKLRQQKEEKLIRLKERLASQEDASCSSSEESGYEDEEVRHYKKKPLSKEKSKTEKEGLERTKSKKKSSTIEGRVMKVDDTKSQLDSRISSKSSITKRLPDELLERLSEKAPISAKVLQFENADENGINMNTLSVQKKRKKATLLNNEHSDGPSDSQSFKKPCSLDYIPLKSTASTKFGIMSLDKVTNVSKSAAQKATEFRQNMMFGNRHKREPANTSLIYQQKLKASGKDVFARKKY